MNKFQIHKISMISFISLLSCYAVFASYFAFKNNVVVKVFEVTPSGTWFVSDMEASIKYEKTNFLKEFLTHFYSYNSDNYRDQVSRAGDFMSPDLWKEKMPELVKISKELEARPLWQSFQIDNVELKGEDEIIADLRIKISERISKPEERRLRVIIKLGKHNRGDQMNSYPYQVQNYVEELRS